MKTMKCDLCDHEASGETFDEWMKNLYPHYMQAHPEVMQNPENGEEEKKKWMEENRARFDATPETA